MSDDRLLEFMIAGGREGSLSRIVATIKNPEGTANMNIALKNADAKLERQFTVIDDTVRQQFFGEEKFDNHLFVTKVTQLENNRYNMVAALFPIQSGVSIQNKIETIQKTPIHCVDGVDKIRNMNGIGGVDVVQDVSLAEALNCIDNLRREVSLIDQEPDWSFAKEDDLAR